MKKLFISFIIMFGMCFNTFAQKYQVLEFSPLFGTVDYNEYTFDDNETFIMGNNIGEYMLIPPNGIIGYYTKDHSAAVVFCNLDIFLLHGWKIEILNEKEYSYYMIYGISYG